MRQRNDAVEQNALDEAIRYISKLVEDRVRHGHFRASIFCEIGSHGARFLVVESGTSERFVIPLKKYGGGDNQ